MVQKLIPPVGLYSEIIEVFQNCGDRPASEIMSILNSPQRIGMRGFPVSPELLLAVIIDNWRVDEDSRFFLYDYNNDQMATVDVYLSQEEASTYAGGFGECIVKRFQV